MEASKTGGVLARCLVVLLCVCFAGRAGAAEDRGWLPEGALFQPAIAANVEALNYLGFVQVEPDSGDDFLMGIASLGLEFPFYRWVTDPAGAFQVELFADFQSQFNMSEMSDPLLNTDYFVGFPLSWQKARWSARVRVYHQSSHLGDELLLSADAPARENLSYEAADVLVAYTLPDGLRFYGGGMKILSKDWEALGETGGHAGVEYISSRRSLLKGRPLLALDALTNDAFDDDVQWHALAGLRYGRETPGSANVTVALQAFDGPFPFGQFFETDSTFYGITLFFTLD